VWFLTTCSKHPRSFPQLKKWNPGKHFLLKFWRQDIVQWASCCLWSPSYCDIQHVLFVSVFNDDPFSFIRYLLTELPTNYSVVSMKSIQKMLSSSGCTDTRRTSSSTGTPKPATSRFSALRYSFSSLLFTFNSSSGGNGRTNSTRQYTYPFVLVALID